MKKKALTISIPENVYSALEQRAGNVGVSVATIILDILYKETKPQPTQKEKK